jgi:hypothetical protein
MVLFVLDSERCSNKLTSGPHLYYRTNAAFPMPSILKLPPGRFYIRSFGTTQNFGSPLAIDYFYVDATFNTTGPLIQSTTTTGSTNPGDDNIYGPNPTCKFTVLYDTKPDKIFWLSAGTFEQGYDCPNEQIVSTINIRIFHNNTYIDPNVFVDTLQPWVLVLEHIPYDGPTN